MSQAFRLNDELALHLTTGLDIRAATGDPDFWHQRDQPELASGRLVSIFSYDSTWDYEERHPDGDELVLVLEGEVDLLLDSGDGERSVHLDAGEACVVPPGTWHRAAIHELCTMLFITPVPARTEHRALSKP